MKKKVLFIIWSFSYGGGAEKILANIVNNLDPNKYEIDILEYLHSDKGFESLNNNITLLPPIVDVTKRDIYSRIKNKIYDKMIYKIPLIIRKIFLNRSYDIEVSFNYLIPSFLLSTKALKRICWVHSSIEDLEDDKKLKKKQRKSFGRADMIVPISNITERSIIEIFPEYKNKCFKIHNGYDFTLYSKEIKHVEQFDLLFCNRLDENKNPFYFIKIIEKLNSMGMKVKAKIIGSGELERDIKKYIELKGLLGQIEVKGYVKNPYSYYSACKIFCLTSKVEGFPTTIVESMYFGKPFVSTPVAGVDELSNNFQCGFIEDNIVYYANSVYELITNNDLYEKMSHNCINEIQKYSIKSQIIKIEELFDC